MVNQKELCNLLKEFCILNGKNFFLKVPTREEMIELRLAWPWREMGWSRGACFPIKIDQSFHSADPPAGNLSVTSTVNYSFNHQRKVVAGVTLFIHSSVI